MLLNFGIEKSKRKTFVTAISEILGEESRYMGAPSFAYSIGQYKVDKNGCLIVEDDADSVALKKLLLSLKEKNYICTDTAIYEEINNDSSDESIEERAESKICSDRVSVIVQVGDGFSETAFNNLQNIINSKANLFIKALDLENMDFNKTDNAIVFPWISKNITDSELSSHIEAVTKFAEKLIEMAIRQKRVSVKEKEIINEKYAMRCFLIRLGFIGTEFALSRKILLSRLSGDAAWLNGKPETIENSEDFIVTSQVENDINTLENYTKILP